MTLHDQILKEYGLFNLIRSYCTIHNDYWKNRFSNDVIPYLDKGWRIVTVLPTGKLCNYCYVQNNHYIYCHVCRRFNSFYQDWMSYEMFKNSVQSNKKTRIHYYYYYNDFKIRELWGKSKLELYKINNPTYISSDNIPYSLRYLEFHWLTGFKTV